MAQTGQRGSGYVSPRNPTGRAFQAGLKAKEQADAAKDRERKALAELAKNGNPNGEDLDEVSERHGGAPVSDDGVVDYTRTYR